MSRGRSFGWTLARVAFHLFGAAVTLFLLLPLVLSLLVSVFPGRTVGVPTPSTGVTADWYTAVLEDPIFRRGLVESLIVGSMTAGFSVALALPLAVAESHSRAVRRLAVVVFVAAFVPPVVLGIQSLVGFEFVGLRQSRLAVALVHTLWGLPLAFLVLRAAYRRLDPTLVEAARSLGASGARAAAEITVPLLWPAIAVAALLAFVASVNELIVSLFLGVRTLPTVIWPEVRHAVQPDVAAASTILLLMTVIPAGLALAVWRGVLARR
ncbi:MAG: ABC transporter permease subunit [Actinomycetota bacterium]|nr:ABC transporter permease subunit [Actinomycetota bacterium]